MPTAVCLQRRTPTHCAKVRILIRFSQLIIRSIPYIRPEYAHARQGHTRSGTSCLNRYVPPLIRTLHCTQAHIQQVGIGLTSPLIAGTQQRDHICHVVSVYTGHFILFLQLQSLVS
jgi:hypothetical protein